MTETLRIERLGAQGDGVTSTSAGPVYVPLTLPGDRVEAAFEDGADRGDLVRVVEPSPDRVAPPCPHFGTCGGCALQHASDAFLAAWKREQVVAALAARGLADVTVAQTLTSPPASRRRAVLSARRTKKTVQVGYHGRGDPTLVPIDTCPLLHPDLLAALPMIRELTPLAASRKAEIRVTATLSEAGLDLAVAGAKPLDVGLRAAAAKFAEEADLARLCWDDEVVALRRPPLQTFGVARVAPPPGGFLQATKHGETALTAIVLEAAKDARRTVDLYAGCGTFSLPLAARTEVLAVEGDAALLGALDRGWREATGLKLLRTETRNLTTRPLLAAELNGMDLAVFDPPRAGAANQAPELAKSDIPVIVGISCNPATFARDARVLVDGGYRLESVAPVDQFRWSPHVELAAVFRR